MTAAAHARARSAAVESLEGRRLLSAADADISFGRSAAADGFAHLPDLGFLASSEASLRMAQVGDGTMFVAGDFKKAGHWTHLGVVKLNAFGAPDMSFGIGKGYATSAMVASPFHTPATERALAVQIDGKVVLAAAAKVPGSKPNVYVDVIAVVRFNPDGTVDSSFGENGIGRIGVTGGALPQNIQVRVLNDGKIVVQGERAVDPLAQTDLYLARFNANGRPDTSLGNGAAQATRRIADNGARPGVHHEILGDGKILVAVGTHDAGVNITRLTPNGGIDTTFGTNGSTQAILAAGQPVGGGYMDIAIQPGGKIVVGGVVGNNTTAITKLARLNPNGTLDPTFGADGVATGPNAETYAISVLGDGTIFGFAGARAYRYDPNGGLDENYGEAGSVTFGGLGLRYDNVQLFDITPAQIPQIDPQGRILLAGVKKTPSGEQTLGVGVMRVGMDAVAYDPDRKLLFIRGTDSGVDHIEVVPTGSAGDVIVMINGDDDTTITGGVVGIHARLGLGDNFFAAVAVAAGMVVSGHDQDTIATGTGNDTIYGHGGGDVIDTGHGHNLVAGAGYAPYFSGGAVTIRAASGNDTIYGSGANDVIAGNDGNDQIFAAAGDDWIVAEEGDDFVDAHLGNDSVWGGGGNDAVYGGKGNDVLHGNANADTVDGGAGADKLYGSGGKDSLLGSDGNDHLRGGDANDRLFGGAGDDHLHGERDHDVLLGNDGHDELVDNLGINYLDGGTGDDKLAGYEAFPLELVSTLIGGDGNDIAWHDAEDVLDSLETAHLINP